ncbi:uncharacterized protein TNCV_1722021 [Trichonephila clavipes]|nr:uncharacterized protein TNCV_1722021 [Trichonephila clavipes]
MRGRIESNKVIREKKDPFSHRSLVSSKPPSLARLLPSDGSKHLLLCSLRGVSISLRSSSLGDQGVTFTALIAFCQRWEKVPCDDKKVSGRSKLILRDNSKLHLCFCPCVDHFHKDAEHSCETKTLQYML